MSLQHRTRPIQVWADVDEGIADAVVTLNTIPEVRTFSSCQGTIGEGGPAPYRAQVMVSWTDEAFTRLCAEFDVTEVGDHWGYAHPRELADALAPPPAPLGAEPTALPPSADPLRATASEVPPPASRRTP